MPEKSKPIIAGTRIGHVHLKVADLDRALGFYRDVLGFELMQRFGDRRRLSSPHRAEYVGEQRRPSAGTRHHRIVPHRHPLSDPR
jgi:catechol-2,3-dioxygenase